MRERAAPFLTVTLAHPDRINQLPLIGIAPDSPALERDLHVLRTKYAALANRVDAETADVFFHGVPRVTTRRSGTLVSPTVSPSQRDKQNAARGAELSAVQKVKDPRATGVSGLATVIWWTPFAFDGEHPLALTLTADNAIIWRDVFVLARE